MNVLLLLKKRSILFIFHTRMMDTGIIAVAILWSILLPFLPDAVFTSLNVYLYAIVLLVLLVLSLNYGRLAGLTTFLAVALTFTERNRRILKSKNMSYSEAANIEQSATTYEKQLADAPPMSPYEVHPEFQTPEEDRLPFKPSGDATDDFSAVGESINEKKVIPTISPNTDVARNFFLRNDLASTTLAPAPSALE